LKNIPVEERPREKLISKGEQNLTEAELLAIVLGAGTRTENAIQLAQRVLIEAGDINTLGNMSVNELCSFHGIGMARATQLKAALELARRRVELQKDPKQQFSNSRMVFESFASSFRGKQQEEFWVIALDAKNKLLSSRMITTGTLLGSLVHPREVFHLAIKNSAAGIIVLHNHPSGDPQPSLEDRKVTSQLAEAAKIMAIPLLDHVIIGTSSYYSFKDAGLL